MRKKLLATFALVLVFSIAFTVTAFANQTAQETRLFDADGNEVFGGSVFYDENQVPVFGPGCWYYAANGSRVNVRGMEAFMYDADGNLVPAPYGAWCRGWNGGRRGSRPCRGGDRRGCCGLG